MNINKIKNYNQILWAAFGTVLFLIALIGLIIIIASGVNNFINDFSDHDNGILSDEKIEKLQKENKRKQVISYEEPQLVDSSNLVYIIPVSHKTLDNAEAITEESALNLLTSRNKYENINKKYSKHFYGNFNNLLIYDYKNQSTNKLFNERVNFESIQTEYFTNDILILIQASTKDTYKDGIINQLDYKSLFIYSFSDKALKEVSLENTDISQVNFVEGTKDLIINFGVDYNKDGRFDQNLEPYIIKKYDYEGGILKNIANSEIHNELQKNLEGSKG